MLKWGLVLLSLYSITLDCISIGYLLGRSYPGDPWESGITIEAARFSQSQPVYEDFKTQHASHLYGWANSIFLGTLFKVLPVSNYTGRVVSLLCALLVMGFLTWWVSRGQPWHFVLFSFASFLSIHHLADNYTVANRPDWPALFFSCLFIFLYRSQRLGAWVCLIVACSFKQTAAMWAAVPLVGATLDSRFRLQRTWVVAAIPLLIVAIYILVIKIFFPWVFLYTFESFRHFPVPLKFVLVTAWKTLCALPLLTALAFAHLIKEKRLPHSNVLGGAFVVTLIACSFAVAKPGGTDNSLIPFYLVSTTLMLLWFPLYWHQNSRNLARPMVSAAMLVLWCLQTFPKGPTLNGYYFLRDNRHTDYPHAVEAVKKLSGTVLCPEDPTLEFFGQGKFGRNFYLEWDARGPWNALPAEMEAYLLGADYVVDVVNWWGDKHLSPEILRAKGFAPDQDLGSYRIWKKVVRK